MTFTLWSTLIFERKELCFCRIFLAARDQDVYIEFGSEKAHSEWACEKPCKLSNRSTFFFLFAACNYKVNCNLSLG